MMSATEGGESANCWFCLTKGGRGVSQLLIFADKGGRVGLDPPIFGWRHMWTAPKRKSAQVTKPILELSESSDEEVDANNSIYEANDDEDENLVELETISVRPTFYVQGAGGVETISKSERMD